MVVKKTKRIKKLKACTLACGLPESSRMKQMGTETAFDVLVRAKQLEAQGKHVIHLEIGEPDFDTPKNIKEAAKKALDEGYTHYGPSQGLPELREAIAQKAGELRGMKFSADEVVVTPGAKPIMSFAIMALVEDGDEVIYVNPGFPIYESMIKFMGGKPIPLPLLEKNNFLPDLKHLKKILNKKTRMLIINTPHNPCGSIMTHDFLAEMAKILEPYEDLWILSDEIYSRITYETPFETIAKFPGMRERTIILDGFSKTYAMTGWRIGYGIMHPDLAKELARIETNINSCTTTFIQRACIEALLGPQDEPERMRQEFKRRRDVIVEGINSIKGFSCKKPEGAFYVFANVKETGYNAKELADRLLQEAGVACLSGTCFGKYGEGYIRFSYANSVENIQEAIRRIKKLIEK
ncbi:MAG: pyridoxal phosphate-dependent aminotransferase [candidate division WOR-3 bacterium]|nr:pyridoxal phosphate-dependent aminotransferase [candidate division WOR-3 bacterium]MCX7756820.1 pyridoxal phosphate-dependent aminotransferase [candidate division WOR-3 bacterium]MDW7988017.1 pyridoxal phosphate-dependent aminotransferase [candidate division WOR-3 bacterium]